MLYVYILYDSLCLITAKDYHWWLSVNPLKTSPEYTRAGVYGKCVLLQNQIVFNRLIMSDVHAIFLYQPVEFGLSWCNTFSP